MSRITKWKLEKTKVKVVFRLQFHATHIPQSGWDKLFISFIPIDSGKTTAKTTKANVRNGTCKWADPIYETTSLLQDAKSKQYDDKIYKFVLAMGSSRSGILGEATINLSDYADALKPSAVALPLHGCNSGAILHVTVQLLTSKTGFREFEQQRDLRERGLLTGNDLNRHVELGTSKILSAEETTSNQVNAKGRSRPESKELPSLEEEGGLTDEYSDSALGLDASSNTSESLYAEKHDTSSMHEIESLKSTVSGDFNGLPSCQSPQKEKGQLSDYQTLVKENNNLIHSWGPNYSMDDLAIAHEENSRLRGNLDAAESSILMLKLEVNSLRSHADEIGIETQRFSHQLSAEIATCEELAKEVSLMKSECSKFKDDLEHLKNLKLSPQIISRENSYTGHEDSFQNIQVRWLKGLLVLEDKIKELQKEACFHERDLSFLHPEFQALLTILHSLKQGTGEVMALVNVVPLGKINEEKTRELSMPKSEQFVLGNNFDVDLCQPDSMFQFLGIPLVSQEPESVTAIDTMKGKVFELLSEVDAAKVERESLARKMDQMECYYEALIQELEENQRQILGELQNLKNEHSTCLYTISTGKAEMESMRHDMNQQLIRFTQEKHDLDVLNKELERRAMTSEAALQRARLNYSIAVDQLQKDLELLSSQVVSMFETNKSLIKQAFSETSPTWFHGYLDTVQNESDANKLLQCWNENAGMRKRHLGGDILLEDLKKSLCLQEELYRKIEEELSEMHSVNLYLDIFSITLHETLYGINADFRLMKEKKDELEQQLELTTESKNLVMARLQTAMNDIHTLNADKASCVSKCTDMIVQNQILEAKLETVTKENCLLMQKITELEELMKECRGYESRYEACCAEKTELAILLQQETLENGNLRSEITCLKKELKPLQAELDDLAFSKENLQKNFNFVQDMLGSLLASCEKQFGGLFPLSSSSGQDLEFKGFETVVLQLEEVQHNTCQKIHQLLEEKKDLENERNIFEKSLSTARSEILVMKQNFKNDMQEMAAKLDLSNALVENLQMELESVAKKFQISSEIEEKYAQQNADLLTDLDLLELELQKLASKSGELAQEIAGLETLAEEFGRSKSTVADLLQDKQSLTISLQYKSDEIVKLLSEIDHLKDSMGFLDEELLLERSFRDKLEAAIADLTAELNEKHDKLLDFDQKKAELQHFRQLASDLELEASRVRHILLQREDCLEKLQEESSHVAVLESQLWDVNEFLITENVKVTFLQTQYQSLVDQLVQQLQSSDGQLIELQKEHLDMEVMFNRHLADELHYIKENGELVTNFESLKSELESSMAQNRALSHSNDVLAVQFEECKKRLAVAEAQFSQYRKHCDLEIERLKHMLASLEEEIGFLIISNEELDITVIVLKAKLDEQHACVTMLEECNGELIVVQTHCSELAHKLSEQTLKTEEFRNLTIHLKELKDKAEAECRLALDKRDREGPSVAMQESLRIAFIKEQYETRLQELRQQLSVSKKHGEEMLLKLQDAIDEIENRKKSEASHLKKNEELSLKILELEGELQSLLSDKREKVKAYDRVKAELECALLSLDCCKEEKEKLEASFQECDKEKSRISVELTTIKEWLENSASPFNIQKDENGCSAKVEHLSNELIIEKVFQENSVAGTPSHEIITKDVLGNVSTGNSSQKHINQDSLVNCEVEDAISNSINEDEMSCVTMNMQLIQDILVSQGVSGISEPTLTGQRDVSPTNSKHLAAINDHAIIRSVRSSFKRLHEELERMKSENSSPPQDYHFEPDFQGLQRELTQLHKANEELQSICPLFNEVSSGGNALERVLALEIELAESLRTRNKSSIHFQSFFLRQHSDEEAVFQSFKDINELIKDMLDLKGRYAAVETELKEMHDRYSQLSLQFAEVEGERQKLMMTLKNVRASRKPIHLNRSSSAALASHPS